MTAPDSSITDLTTLVSEIETDLATVGQVLSIQATATPTMAMFSLMSNENNDIIFDLLANDNLGGNSKTTVDHFERGSTQQFDVSELLSDEANKSNVSEYLSVSYDAEQDQAVISIDRDGTSDQYQAAELLVLNHQTSTITLDELLQNNQIII